ncbi:hypothetical protein, partial [Acidisphaera sp. S103]|uniref:hypothetical protein n=1 Tax=Acidisphaera sp. S103 TaxID=1747223 RepID=UPI001C2094EF
HEARHQTTRCNPRKPAYCETGRPYLRRTSGLGNKTPPSSELLKLAKWLKTRKRALREDSTLYDGGRSLTDFSGVAQMEAIAYSCQLAVLQYELGTDAIELLHNHSPLPTTQSRRYAWARDFWTHMPPHPEFPPSADIVNMDVMMALMVASLCGKMFTLPDEPSVPFERTQPSWRLLKLFTSERWAKYASAEAGELWSLVDAKAKELWGFTVEEELVQDWETEGRLVAEFRARHSDAAVVRAFEKYHNARKRVIDDFIASPTNYTSTAGYWKTVNEGISPLQVVSSPKGSLWSSTAEPLFDYDFSHLGSHPILRGWHAVVNPNAVDDGDSKIKLGFDDDWRAVLTEFSPVTKLLVSGRAQRVMVGAELTKGEALLKKTGFTFRFVPPYEIYEERVNGEEFRHLSGLDQAPCDFTGKLIMAPDFDFISPWEIRSDKAFRGFLTYIAERMESEPMAALTLAKDWSYWLTSKEHARELRQRFGLPL